MESEAVRMIPEVEEACSTIVSAAMQLVYTVRSPMSSITSVILQVSFVFQGLRRILTPVCCVSMLCK